MNKTDTGTCRRCGLTGSEFICSKCKKYLQEEYLALISSIKGSIELGKTEKGIKLVDIIMEVCEDYKKLGELDREGHLSVKDDLIAREVWGINAWFAVVAVNDNKIIEKLKGD